MAKYELKALRSFWEALRNFCLKTKILPHRSKGPEYIIMRLPCMDERIFAWRMMTPHQECRQAFVPR